MTDEKIISKRNWCSAAVTWGAPQQPPNRGCDMTTAASYSINDLEMP